MGVKLYELLPTIMRVRSELAGGENPEGILEGIAYALEQEADTTLNEIQALTTLIDPDNVDQQYLL